VTYLGNHSQTEAGAVHGLISAFNARTPNVKAELFNSTSQYQEKLRSMLGAGTPPDMFRFGANAWAPFLVQGALAEIGTRIKRDRYDLKDFIDVAVTQYTWRGKQIGLGSNVGYGLIFYNTAMFQQDNVPAPGDDWTKPWTWAQFLETLKRVSRQPAAAPLPGAGQDASLDLTAVTDPAARFGFTMISDYSRLLPANGARPTNDDETRTLYDSPEGIEAWEWLYDLVHTHRVAQNPQTHQALSPSRAFTTHKAATWIGSTSGGISALAPQRDLAWDVAPLPRGPQLKSDKWVAGGGSGWYLTSGSRSVDATWELLKDFLSPESGQALAAVGISPVRVSVLNSPAWLRSDQPPKSKRVLVEALKMLMPAPTLVNQDEFQRAVNAEVDALWTGERRGREVAQRIRRATDPILAEHQRVMGAMK